MIFFMDTSDNSEFNRGYSPILPYLKENTDRYFLLNFMSPYSLGTKLTNLTPPYDLTVLAVQEKEEEFEHKYFDYLLYDKDAFIDLMEIMMAEYYGQNVIVLTDLSVNVISQAVECIRNFIRKRYEENTVLIEDISDLLETYDESEYEMSPMCYPIFNRDKEYYLRETVDPEELLRNSYQVEYVNGRNI